MPRISPATKFLLRHVRQQVGSTFQTDLWISAQTLRKAKYCPSQLNKQPSTKLGLWLPIFVIFSKQFQFFASVHPFCTSFEYFPPLFCIFSAQNLPAAYPAAYTGYPLKRYYLLLRIKMFDFFLGNVFELET